jgi:hypothetical protein
LWFLDCSYTQLTGLPIGILTRSSYMSILISHTPIEDRYRLLLIYKERVLGTAR